MAWKFSISATCDKCRENLIPVNMRKGVETLTTLESVKTARWCMQRQWSREGVMQGLPNMAGKRSMLCARCAGS